MVSFLDKLKSGADKAALEADKLRRTTLVRSNISALQGEVSRHTRTLGETAMQLYDAGSLDQPELARICRDIAGLRQQIAAKEAEIEEIRQETLPEEPASPQPKSARYGHICPKCHIQLPAEARFCPECGGPAADVAPPTPEPPAASALCATCGGELVAGSAFCPQCGAAVPK
jgi:RNA polymerase subunit RPABC4/transcription elongation factor Spt4